MYKIADFLLVQLSLSRFTLIKNARSSHVCLNYISTAQFYHNHNIRCHRNMNHYSIFFPADIRLNISGGDFG